MDVSPGPLQRRGAPVKKFHFQSSNSMVMQEVELDGPPTALLARCAGEPGAFVLDGGARSWGCGDAVLGFRPCAVLRVDAAGGTYVEDGPAERWQGDPFVLLERFRERCRAAVGSSNPGAVIIAALSYDLRHWVERLPCTGASRAEPVLYAAFYDWSLRYSYADARYRLFCSTPAQAASVAAELQDHAADHVRLAAQPTRLQYERAKDEYLASVGTALRYIAAGDIYQVNLAQRFVVEPAPPPALVFSRLQGHPMPYAAYVDAGDIVLISNSPECWLAIRERTVATFPIKGTRPRGAGKRRDARLAEELQRSAKERAEHLMIVDLERNDLGRVCRTGSVRVERLAAIESYPTLHHLVSKVSGELRPEVTLADVLRATFPGGSITGAPKVRAMQIIDELEPVPRGFYTGAIGYVDFLGNAVFNIAIRTAVAAAGRLTYHAGGGIVADSVAEWEYQETLLKAQPFFEAVSAPA